MQCPEILAYSNYFYYDETKFRLFLSEKKIITVETCITKRIKP